MKEKAIIVLLLLTMLFSVSACGTGSGENSSTPDKSDAVSSKSDGSSSQETDYYSNKVYAVGADIPVGQYLINCTGTDYAMSIIVFSSDKEYKAFQNADQSTVGEFGKAVEENAWADFGLKKDDSVYIGLEKGNIILLDKGKCEFNKYDIQSDSTLYSGIYIVGDDIAAGSYNIKCTTQYLGLTLFADRDSYLGYHRASRFSNGDESDAKEEYADSVKYLYKDESYSVNLQDGMVLKMEDGAAQYEADSGPVIN